MVFGVSGDVGGGWRWVGRGGMGEGRDEGGRVVEVAAVVVLVLVVAVVAVVVCVGDGSDSGSSSRTP